MSETIPRDPSEADIKVIYEGPSGIVITYDPSEPGGEVSIAGEFEQERMVLSTDGWADLADAVTRLGREGLEDAPEARR